MMTSSLPHPIEVEVEARAVIARAYVYRLSNPEKLAAAYRVIERNTEARRSQLRLVAGEARA